jgi:hypothetical protein
MEPLTWVYLAMLAASTAANAKAQQKTNRARAKVQSEDTRRRKEQQRESEAAALKTQDAYFNQRNKAEEREAELAQQFAPEATPTPTSDASGSRFLATSAPTGSTRTVEATQQEMAKGLGRASQRATSRAQLGAFSDAMQASGLEAGRNAQDIGISASNLQGWTQNVLPALYAKANVAGKDWATTADILKLAAAVTSFGAMSGAGAGANAGSNASTATTLDQMSGVPAQFAGKDLFGMGQSFGGGFSGLSGMETASIADAASRAGAMDLAELGMTQSDFMPGGNYPWERYGSLFDSNWWMPPGQRRMRPAPAKF